MCTSFVAKLVLGLVNTLVFLAGAAMFVVGLLIQTYPDFSKKTLSSVLDQLKSVAGQAGVTVDTSQFSVADIAFSFSVAIMAMGLVLAAVSVLGLVGVKYGIKTVLVVYFVVTLVLFLAQVVVVLIAALDRKMFDDTVKPHLKDTITDQFTGLEGKDAATQIWNGIQSQLKCCGVDSYTDYEKASKWSRTFKTATNLVTPISCCRTISSTDFSCAQGPTDTTKIWDTGCYTKIWDYLLSNSGIVIGIAAGILCAQLVILLLTFILIRDSNKVSSIV